MSLFTLALSERRALKKQIHHTKDVKILKRAQALVWLDEGLPVQTISQRLGVTSRTIYVWVSLYENRRNTSFIDRLQDRPRSGRTPRKSTIVLRELPVLLHQSPRQHGYHYANWTSSLLKHALQSEHNMDVSTKTIRLCLHQLHYVWKRPRYALARQSPTWTQEKGGSKKVSIPTQGL
jgi:transposase